MKKKTLELSENAKKHMYWNEEYDESWEKVNALMVSGDFSMYASDWGDQRHNRISIGYTKSKDETVSKSFSGVEINKMVDEAFDWATKEGYLQKK